MDTQHAILRVLHTDPTDAVAWLALADALEESGQPDRADLTRLRVTLLADPNHADVQHRAQALLDAGVRPCVPTVRNALGMTFALVPPGRFLMGSLPGEVGRFSDEGPAHPVTITRAFYLAVHPVTQAQFHEVLRYNPSYFSPDGNGRHEVVGLDTASFPAESVRWEAACEFCARLARFPVEAPWLRGLTYRLPTEAEWEYACRSGTSTPFHFGATMLPTQANFDARHRYPGAPGGPWRSRPVPVGGHPANLFGLFDMHGNVWEWCHDWFADFDSPDPHTDPLGPLRGTARVFRGGSWFSPASTCRSACRNTSANNNTIGFRVALGAAP